MKYYLDSSDLRKVKELWQWYMRSKNSINHRRRPRTTGVIGSESSLAIYTAVVTETPNAVDEPKYYLCRIKDDSIASWAANTAYVTGDVRQDNDKTWTCLQNHTSNITNRPPNAAFWSEIQPIQVYPKGSFNNSEYDVTECEPQFVQGDEIPVYQIDSVWYADITILYVGANGSRKWDTSEKRVMSVYR